MGTSNFFEKLELKDFYDFMMSELTQKSCISVKLDLLQQKAINFYRKNCQSIEIVKDDELQKVNFRVKNKVYNLDKYPKYYIV